MKRKAKKIIETLQIVLPTMVLALGFASPAQSSPMLSPTPYLDFADSAFNGLNFSYFYLENFEDGALNTPGVFASGGRVLHPAAFTDSVDADDGAVNGYDRGHSWYSNNLSSVIFTFEAGLLGKLPTHVGIVWTDVGFTTEGSGVGPVVFEAFDATDTSLGAINSNMLGDGLFTGETAEDRFFGVINAGGISTIKIAMPTSVDWEMDHLQYGYQREIAEPPTGLVPEPMSILLVGTGLAALARRRKSI